MIGASGKMGKTIIRLISETPELELVGAIEQENNSMISKDAGSVAGTTNLDVKITTYLVDAVSNADVVIDFSSPKGTPALLEAVNQQKKPLIIGTTGHDKIQKTMIKKASSSTPILMSPNMSVGVNLLWKLTEMAANVLGKDFSVSINEKHHINKKDAPSGTANKLIEIIANTVGYNLDTDVRFTENKKNAPPTHKPIAVNAIREGEVVGEHTIYFTSKEEKIGLAHMAYTRDIFAKGALSAATWIKDKPAGLYNMQDVLFSA